MGYDWLVTNELGLVHCIRCGEILDDEHRDYLVHFGLLPACDDCEADVAEVWAEETGMWPSDYYGHCFLNADNILEIS